MTAQTKKVLTPENVFDLIPRPVGEIKRDRKFNLLVYGDNRVGKTHLIGTADEVPECRTVLHLDIGGGSVTLDRLFPNVHTLAVPSWKSLRTIYEKLFYKEDGFDIYNTVGMDHVTETQKVLQRWVMEIAYERAKLKGKEDEIEPEVPRQRDYLVMYERLMGMIRDFRDLPVNFICTSYAKEHQHPRTKQIKFKPALSGQARSDILGEFDIIAYLHTERVDGKDVRLFSTKDTSDYLAGQRGTDLPEHLADATIEDILSYMPRGETA